MEKPLSIVHINSHDFTGGAARVAWRLAEGERQLGHDAVVLAGYRTTGSPYSHAMDLGATVESHNRYTANGLLYYEFEGSHKLLSNPLVRRADIVHLHNLHGDYFNPFSLPLLSRFKKIVWTLHDMQAFTGHCAHSLSCERWRAGCGACPHLLTYPALRVDTTKRLWQEKKLIYDHSSLQIVSPSRWLENKLSQSMLKAHPRRVIYNAIDTSVFEFKKREELRRKLSIPEEAVVIGCAAAGGVMTNPWKGGNYALTAIKAIRERYPTTVFLNIGGGQSRSEIPGIVNIPNISNEQEMAAFYSVLDIFLFTSIAENCPLAVLEAMSCSIPVVSFATGGVPELVRSGTDGIVVQYLNVASAIEALARLIEDRPLRQKMSRNARSRILECFSHKDCVSNYLKLYEQILSAGDKKQTQAALPLHLVPEEVRTKFFLTAHSADPHRMFESDRIAREGLKALESGRLDNSKALLSLAVELDPINAEAHKNLGLTFLRLGFNRPALTHLSSALQWYPNDQETIANLSSILSKPEDMDAARPGSRDLSLLGSDVTTPIPEKENGAYVYSYDRFSQKPLLMPESDCAPFLKDLRVALIYDNVICPDTTGEYVRRALEKVCSVRHFLPPYLGHIRQQEFDLFINIDDGLQYTLPPHLRPSVWWAADTHLAYDWCAAKARSFDAVFAAHRESALKLRKDGIPAVWLPLAADPSVHRPLNVAINYDWSFIDNCTDQGNPFSAKRAELISLLKAQFPRHFAGRAFGENMCRVYSQSELVFNQSISDDVSADIFKALACGRPLITNNLNQNGMGELFCAGRDLIVFDSSRDLVENVRMILANERYRNALGRSARQSILSKHTYYHRVLAMFEMLLKTNIVSPARRQAQAFGLEYKAKEQTAPAPLTSIIILTLNQLDCTKNCLASIRENTPLPYELIIVDNGSTDGTLEYLEAFASTNENVKVVSNKSNRGFAAGNNQGMALAKGEYILLLNNDTVLTPGWLERMQAVFKRHPNTGVVGPRSNYVAGPQLVEDASYGNLNELEDFSRKWAENHAKQSSFCLRAVGFCLLTLKAVVDRIGGLDDTFGIGNFEDDDFCLRATLCGFELRIAHDAFIHHVGSQTFKGTGVDYRESINNNWEVFKAKWGIPKDTPFEGYTEKYQQIVRAGANSFNIHVKLPDPALDHFVDTSGKWWQE